MLEQTHSRSESDHDVRPACGRSPSPAPDAAARDPLIEDYLDHLCAPLVGAVPYPRRRELREEWGAHLDSLVEAHREMGYGPAGSVVEALRQFGPPEQVSRQWLQEVRPAAP